MSSPYPGVERCPYQNRAYRGAYFAAYWRAYGGGLRPKCPYRDLRSPSGRITFSRGFIRAFDRGWLEGRKDLCASQGKGKRKGV
jgi:hypothetical protein